MSMTSRIQFEESFFEREEREGFSIAPMMKRCWAAQMEVLKEIEIICKRHGISFYADWGTLLGTVRHHGFIPWDDDMDIAMKREDYQRFWQIAKEELPEGYKVLNIHTEAQFEDLLTRVVNSGSICLDESFLKKYHGCPYAVGIDVFPLDYIPRNKEEETVQTELITIVFGAKSFLESEEADEEAKEEMLEQVEQLCGISLDRKKPMKQQLLKLGEQLCGLYTDADSDTLTSMPDFVNGWEYRASKAGYGDVIQMPFENITMPVPVGYDEILTIKYGDYRTPVYDATNHNYPFYQSQEEILEKYLKEHGISGERFYLEGQC